MHDAHSNSTVPAVPPEIGFAIIQAGGLGTSLVGVTLYGYDIGTPREPSAYSITIAALYCLSSRNSTVTPLLSALVTVALVRDQKSDLMYVENESRSSRFGSHRGSVVESHTYNL